MKKMLFWRNPLTVIAMLLLVILLSAILCSAFIYNSYSNDIHWIEERAAAQNWSGNWRQEYEDAIAQKQAFIERNVVAQVINSMANMKILRFTILFVIIIVLMAAIWWLAKAPMKPRKRIRQN